MLQSQSDATVKNTQTADLHAIRQDPLIEKVLKRSPSHIADSFTNEQLKAIKQALGPTTWGGHFLDSRGTFKFPFIKWRFYYVLLIGKNKRAYTRREKTLSMLMMFGSISAFILISMLFGLLMLYLLKSALGIDLFPNTSLGIWDSFKSFFDYTES